MKITDYTFHQIDGPTAYVHLEVISAEPITLLTWDGENITGATIASCLFRAEFYELDEDGGAAEYPSAVISAHWHGGCYVDLGGDLLEADEIFPHADPGQYLDPGASEVVNISDGTSDPYTVERAWMGFIDWCESYAESDPDDRTHDFECYGFAR